MPIDRRSLAGVHRKPNPWPGSHAYIVNKQRSVVGHHGKDIVVNGMPCDISHGLRLGLERGDAMPRVGPDRGDSLLSTGRRHSKPILLFLLLVLRLLLLLMLLLLL